MSRLVAMPLWAYIFLLATSICFATYILIRIIKHYTKEEVKTGEQPEIAPENGESKGE